MLEMKNGENVYPDANSTMRLTYETVVVTVPRCCSVTVIIHYPKDTSRRKPQEHEFYVNPALKAATGEGFRKVCR